MHVSVFMGPAALTSAQDGPLISQCLRLSEQAAQAGFAMVTFGEQHFNNYEPYSNPFLMAARLAPVLGDCWFGTTIVPLPFQHVLRLAEESSIVDVLTGGRLLMGMSAGRVGIGSDWVNFNADETRRQEAFDSKLDLLLKAYRQKAGDPPLVFDNDFDRGRLTGRMMPAPYRDGGPQLAIGTNTDATIDDVAARGLALFLGPCPLPDALAKFARHRAALVAAGFSAAHVDDATAKSLVTRYVIVGPTEDEAWQAAERMAGRSPLIDRSKDPRSLRELSQVPLDEVARDLFPRNVLHVRGWMTVGTPDSVTTQLRAYVEQGVRHLNTRFTVGTYNPDLVQRSFDLFVDEVLPALEPELFRGPSLQQIAPEHRPDADVMAVPAQPRADLPRPTFVAGSPVPANS